MPCSIQFVYFDLGNVLLNFDHARAIQQINQLTGVSKEQVKRILFDSEFQNEYETGGVSTREFFDHFCEQTRTQADLKEFCHAASSIFEVNTPMMPIVASLKTAGVRTGILSNTCEAHWQFVTDGRYGEIPGLFETCVLSYEEKSMKPDRRIYDAAISRCGCQPSEIFFMDDRIENVEGAIAAGIDAVQYIDTSQLRREMMQRNIPIATRAPVTDP